MSLAMHKKYHEKENMQKRKQNSLEGKLYVFHSQLAESAFLKARADKSKGGENGEAFFPMHECCCELDGEGLRPRQTDGI